ncbi:Maf domain-containing protein [Rhizoctonia solani AG-1 IA]|uniref:Maf domain-containing protein n=1 Tax=Thanatephorus cucumeris (strain AG1-IA) TaxID=983506 RepID=L8WQS1_THACA|nr:Maf domain-containing protein [Rhizoctonia solani AG-1 IA]
MTVTHNSVLPNALRIPALTKLANKRIVLASASPRRLQILRQFQGLDPEIVPSKFAEDLPHDEFSNVYEYPVATATEKAVEVYVRMVVSAETFQTTPFTRLTLEQNRKKTLTTHQVWLSQKPQDKGDNLRMLLELNGGRCEVVTGVSVVYPILTAPGYAIKSMDDRCIVHFHDSDISILEAYVDSEEGIDRAGGFALQERGAHLVSKVEGDFYNAVGFPGSAFFKWIGILINEEDDFMDFDI